MSKLVEVATAKALGLHVKVEEKQSELNEDHKLWMDMLESMIDDHSKELAHLRDKVVVVEKSSGCTMEKTTLETDIDELKKELTSLLSIDLRTFFYGLEGPPLRVDMVLVPDKQSNVEVMGVGD